MPILHRDLRRQLEKTIAGEKGARQIAERGAEQSLHRLAVDSHEPHTALTPDERTQRNQLRAHGRQLGDKRDPQRGTQTIKHLKQAVAYEHWHRMLFARFLAENDLLLHPRHGVALSLDEIKELALGLKRDWIEVAAEYAQRMLLREVFRSGDPALEVPLPPEARLELETKLSSLPREVFLADDSLGWVYQFWQRDAKEAVLESEIEIGADELAPVTQLFTEDYMVLFVLENTLGAWWTARHGSRELPGYTWQYLRQNDDAITASGSFDDWPKYARDLRILDPCMGSGHFLTFALPILAHMRMAEDGLSWTEAIASALQDNLFGLELDPRCSQIAAFNLALTAWKLASGHFELPRLNLACSGLGINAKEEDWVRFAEGDGRKQDLMRWLYSLFSKAPTLGSLIDPRRVGKPIVQEEVSGLLPLLEQAMAGELLSDEKRELLIAAQGVLKAMHILAAKFTLVATNVPYLGRRKQDGILKQYCTDSHDDAKADLSTTFIDRCVNFCSNGGTMAVVSPQNWLFLGTYKAFRKRLLATTQWNLVVKLGPNAFQDMNWWAATTSILILTNTAPKPAGTFSGFEVSDVKEPADKAARLKAVTFSPVSQASQVSNPDGRILFAPIGDAKLLADFATFGKGSTTGDSPRYLRYFWEFDRLPQEAVCWLDSPVPGDLWSGRTTVLSCGLSDKSLQAEKGCFIRGQKNWGKTGIAVNKSNKLEPMIYTGEVFDDNLGTLVPNDVSYLPALLAYCQSPEYSRKIRLVDQKVGVTAATLVKVTFDLDEWIAHAKESSPICLTQPNSSDPTQWLFGGCPTKSTEPLQVAVARMLSYRWPRQSGSSFPNCPCLAADGLDQYAAPDGIVCIASVVGEDNAAARLRTLLRAAYGPDYNVAGLLNKSGADTLEDWIRDRFFAEHCDMFRQHPFIWHIWDGREDGFQALVNYHKLDRKNLEKLIYYYLGDWLTRQRQDIANRIEGADGRVVAAEHLQGELKKVLEGEAPYDIFARWKPLKKQPIGWEPDLKDGVRVNIRPWIVAARLYKATKGGILRVTPSLKYTKDRGKEPVRDLKEYPWFKGSIDRSNDHHLSLNEKREAREL